MIVSRLNLMILVAAAGGAVWIEHSHRITIAMQPPTELAARTSACPENESVPFSADCMRDIQSVGFEVRPRLNATGATMARSPDSQ
jgi:hypothetical protein